MNLPTRVVVPLLALNLIVSAAALYFAVNSRASSPVPTPVAVPASGLASVPIDGLSLRFRHSELFESAHDMARPAALGELIRRGALRPGMTDRETAFLLGDAEGTATGEAGDQSFAWHYGLPGGNLVLEFSAQRVLLRAFQTHDGDPDHAHSEPLF
ncbi:hypothetical protein OKA05_08220 [Luteolibacter arcticus]|uniref:Uncharacterized protein n=1 Tax=Luteolibacter arcticus TaxID=1581411 RepID=A0ABT3GFZ8_9BACT|nr:hypothetical protein [Luteolibacter arcticus]MCW1922537.1 hypothetical protein [Luteolibacter arcticus]